MEKYSIQCLLCASENHEFFFKDQFRTYRRCDVCSLLFVPREFHVSPESEKARYEEHNNDADDIGYRNFLERIAVPIRERFETGAKGLDFGCGPTPLLANILAEDGFKMEVYDPLYARDKSVLESKFDFIVSTEVFEHLSEPLKEIKKLLTILKPNGLLALMTRLYDNSIDFRGWHYKNDRTHIAFFTLDTLSWISEQLTVKYLQIESDIFVFYTNTQN